MSELNFESNVHYRKMKDHKAPKANKMQVMNNNNGLPQALDTDDIESLAKTAEIDKLDDIEFCEFVIRITYTLRYIQSKHYIRTDLSEQVLKNVKEYTKESLTNPKKGRLNKQSTLKWLTNKNNKIIANRRGIIRTLLFACYASMKVGDDGHLLMITQRLFTVKKVFLHALGSSLKRNLNKTLTKVKTGKIHPASGLAEKVRFFDLSLANDLSTSEDNLRKEKDAVNGTAKQIINLSKKNEAQKSTIDELRAELTQIRNKK